MPNRRPRFEGPPPLAPAPLASRSLPQGPRFTAERRGGTASEVPLSDTLRRCHRKVLETGKEALLSLEKFASPAQPESIENHPLILFNEILEH